MKKGTKSYTTRKRMTTSAAWIQSFLHSPIHSQGCSGIPDSEIISIQMVPKPPTPDKAASPLAYVSSDLMFKSLQLHQILYLRQIYKPAINLTLTIYLTPNFATDSIGREHAKESRGLLSVELLVPLHIGADLYDAMRVHVECAYEGKRSQG